MSISSYNYEAYFLDYYEGKLDAQATQELMDFIARHPELKEEFESFEAVSLKDFAEDIKFENKESLKKPSLPVSASNFDELAISYIEGTLSPDMQVQFLNFVEENPAYKNELALYQNTKLTADTSIIFEDKDSLKRGASRRPVAWYYWAAAASVALLITAYFILGTRTTPDAINLASTPTLADTNHAVVQPIHTSASNQAIAKNTIKHSVSGHTHKAIPIARHTVQPKQNNIAIVKTVSHKDSVKVAMQNHTVVNNPDTTKRVNATHFVISHPIQDTAPATIAANKTDSIGNNTRIALDSTVKEKKPLFVFAANTIKKIGSLFKHKIGINKFYNKSSDKVIAYQVMLGNDRYTLRFKNNAY